VDGEVGLGLTAKGARGREARETLTGLVLPTKSHEKTRSFQPVFLATTEALEPGAGGLGRRAPKGDELGAQWAMAEQASGE
jgi:hypothetical protein